MIDIGNEVFTYNDTIDVGNEKVFTYNYMIDVGN